jgi:hypothetical protein
MLERSCGNFFNARLIVQQQIQHDQNRKGFRWQPDGKYQQCENSVVLEPLPISLLEINL